MAQHRWTCRVEACEKPTQGRTKQKCLTSEGAILEEMYLDSPNAKQSRHTALLYIFEDSEAVIMMIIEDITQESPAQDPSLSTFSQPDYPQLPHDSFTVNLPLPYRSLVTLARAL